ncbi:FAD/NAD(P)-binding domain-containing protein [Trematosphaeria pertusa]|uniref:FAD/NAD(P)-binding domain-containing protein n=1 Tax=Trematosphaeria pertusa TaxID=390896 RepID=A0A6A6IT49_9PLEO|nr:FAD/NAD(P)-binding domain-containing protein [Trematosphaeria pertusa]KAF2253681.1 FAD/NAD(P)-binding domain-containing protein [Trematosphaeria pertusa]
MSSPDAPNILIIGGGIFGTSTAYHLSLTHPCPSKITILDRSPYPPYHAASTDINKIVRADYTTPFYMDLAFEALHAWKTLPVLRNADGRRFFHESGWVMLSNEGNDLAERIRRNFRDRGGDRTSDVEIDERVRAKWGDMLREAVFDEEGSRIEKGYWNPEAGWADAGDAVAKMMEDAVSRGVRYEKADVDSVIFGEDGVRGAKTKDERTYSADKVLLAAGAWTSQLLSPVEDELGIQEEDRVEKQVTAAGVCVVHYKLNEEEYQRLKDMPVVIYGDRGEVLPPPEKTRLLKFTNARSFTNTITTPSGHRISIPPDNLQTTVSSELQTETLSRIVSKTMPSFASRSPDYWRLCWDSISPSQDQLITRHPHPRLSNLYLAVGGSFHSWKFLPTIGKYVVNVLNGVSNGEEKDRRWCWKTGKVDGRGAHEKVVPRRELRDLEG